MKSPPRPTPARAGMLDISTEAITEDEIRSPGPEKDCTVCKEDGSVIVAVSSCTKCNDKLCRECTDSHKKNQFTRKGHKILLSLVPILMQTLLAQHFLEFVSGR